MKPVDGVTWTFCRGASFRKLEFNSSSSPFNPLSSEITAFLPLADVNKRSAR
jgi:hypothetical protein